MPPPTANYFTRPQKLTLPFTVFCCDSARATAAALCRAPAFYLDGHGSPPMPSPLRSKGEALHRRQGCAVEGSNAVEAFASVPPSPRFELHTIALLTGRRPETGRSGDSGDDGDDLSRRQGDKHTARRPYCLSPCDNLHTVATVATVTTLRVGQANY